MLSLLIIFALWLVGGILLLKLDNDDLGWKWNVGFPLTICAAIGLIVTAIIWPVDYNERLSSLRQYQATKTTIEEARKSGASDIERAALTQKIIEINQKLADAKYWNQTTFGDAVPDEYANLDYLK